MASGLAGLVRGSRLLALIPIGSLVSVGLVAFPRAVAPRDVPLPRIDARSLDATLAEDAAVAKAAHATGVEPETRLLGTRMREFLIAQTTETDEQLVSVKREAVLAATREVFEKYGPPALKRLRAIQVARFVEEVAAFERTGQSSPELVALAGGFVERLRGIGWIEGSRVLLDGEQRRVAYKLMWNGTAGVDEAREMALSLDEMRALYTLYLQHPHVPEATTRYFEERRRAATTPEACAAVEAEVSMSREKWRLEKVRRLGEIDPTYPAEFALGVATYRTKSFAMSGQHFQTWLREHPEGGLAQRAQNHLRAAMLADSM